MWVHEHTQDTAVPRAITEDFPQAMDDLIKYADQPA